MDRGDNPSGVFCSLCGEAFTLLENEVEGNLPRVLQCGHIYCTSCLVTIQCDNVIKCPECEVVLTLPEDGVYGLQEDSRIIGLIYTMKMNKNKRSKNQRWNKMSPSTDINANTDDTKQKADVGTIEKVVDEALVRAAENLAELEHINETLTSGLAEQVRREKARLEKEIKQAADKAVHSIHKWKDVQLSQLGNLQSHFSSSQAEVCIVQKRMKALDIAMQIAREVRRVPFLEQYCTLDSVLETLLAPVDRKSFNMKCITVDSGMSCVFQSEGLNNSLSLSLKMEVTNSKRSPPLPGSFPNPKPRRRSSLPHHGWSSDPAGPDVITEEVLGDRKKPSLPPTGPELANVKWRIHGRRKHQLSNNKRDVTQWVVVTHIVNPSHFYVRYVAERREAKFLSKKINHLCSRERCHFTSADTLESGSLVFVKWKEGLWSRAAVVAVVQSGCVEAVSSCPVPRLASVRVFFLDYGLTKSITIQGEEDSTEASLRAVNSELRKVDAAVKAELGYFAPEAVRCSLKDLVPYDLTKGWSKEALVEFSSVAGSAAVEMRLLGQDSDSLLVDLRKAPMDQSSEVSISIREYLVFIEVARFYSPVTLGTRPLRFYLPVHPAINTQLNAVVSHINNPADFYVQLVDNMESLLLSAKLQECYNATTVEENFSVYCPVLEQACVARYDDKLWYRAQVIGHPGARKVEVRYVDFGNKKIVSVSDLRKIKDEFFALPSMAINCRLSDVIPLDGETWSDACTSRFISLLQKKLVTVVATESVPRSERLPVQLFESAANVAELLVKEELACFREGLKSSNAGSVVEDSAVWDPPLDCGLTTEDEEAQHQNVPAEQNEEFQTQLKLPDQLSDLKVRVSHVNSPSSFYVQLTQHGSLLRRIYECVKQECVLVEPQEDVVWKKDMHCAAHIHGVWERGQLCSDVTSSNVAEVMRCDHGNKVKLDVRNLRPLPTSLIGSLALECTLTDIRPAGGRSTWTATACDLFSYYLTGASAVITIKELTDERPVPVSLFCSNKKGQFVNIADFLTSEGLALRVRKPRVADTEKPKENDAASPVSEAQSDGPDGVNKTNSPRSPPSPPTPPKPAPRTFMSAEKVKTQLYQPPELPCLGRLQIRVSAVGEDGIIYARTQHAECQLEQLRERIQQSMKTLPRQKLYTWKSVLGCAVIGPDMLWYRGQMLQVLGGHVKVQYVDFGLVENIPVVHVYPVLLCDDVPQLCFPCQLHSINPVGGQWQREAVALLKELLLNRHVDMQITELPSDPRGVLTVELFVDGMNLRRILLHHEHTSVDDAAQKEDLEMSPAPVLDYWDIDTEGLRGPEEPLLGSFIYPNLPQEGEQLQVKVKHLWTPNELFLWPLLEGSADVEVDGETLDEALTRINADISSLLPLSHFHYGAPCLAEYCDGKFYRATLEELSSVEPARLLVQHVDFGSDDTLPTSRLRRMPAELLGFPSRALKVRVGGFRAPRVSGQREVLPYSPAWSVEAAMEMIDLLHGNITATVVTREPELTVLLYNEDGDPVHLPLVSSGLVELE